MGVSAVSGTVYGHCDEVVGGTRDVVVVLHGGNWVLGTGKEGVFALFTATQIIYSLLNELVYRCTTLRVCW